MSENTTLRHYLNRWSATQPGSGSIAEIIECIAIASIKLADTIASNLIPATTTATRSVNSDNSSAQPLDVQASRIYIDALRYADVRLLVSNHSEDVLTLNPESSLAVAIAALDGSSNVDTNLSIGTIFSIMDLEQTPGLQTAEGFIGKTGRNQVAAGFLVYGPQTTLVLSCLNGTHLFALDRNRMDFMLIEENIYIPSGRREFAINVSNYRYWDNSIRGYVDDCLAGVSGPREADFTMRWAASLVVEAYRIFVRGGIFLYPRDSRPDYKNGRSQLLFEAFPIALLVEQANGAATDGEDRILDKPLSNLNDLTPLIFGSTDKVARIAGYYKNPPVEQTRYALFGSRTLLRTRN